MPEARLFTALHPRRYRALTVVTLSIVIGILGPTGIRGETFPLSRDRAIALHPVFGEPPFQQPLGLEFDPVSGDGFVVEQRGSIVRVSTRDGRAIRTPFIDISSRVVSGGERGLLGLALDPTFATSGVFFLHYSKAPHGETIIARYRTASSGQGEPASERVILKVPQPYTNHNGGQIRFGPDGYLYIALGDGGSAGDPAGYAQDRGSLLGKILRLDVRGENATAYRIPPDNPFRAPGERPEVFALGLRNPWRFSFDRDTGALWAGDVGQNAWEEVDVVSRGGNYGWNILEGTACFKPRQGCPTLGLTPPIHTYPHTEGRSVTGGFVYRGKDIPTLRGRYVFGDFVSGTIWSIALDGGGRRVALESPLQISSFGEDPAGELYVVGYGTGTVHRVRPASPTP